MLPTVVEVRMFCKEQMISRTTRPFSPYPTYQSDFEALQKFKPPPEYRALHEKLLRMSIAPWMPKNPFPNQPIEKIKSAYGLGTRMFGKHVNERQKAHIARAMFRTWNRISPENAFLHPLPFCEINKDYIQWLRQKVHQSFSLAVAHGYYNLHRKIEWPFMYRRLNENRTTDYQLIFVDQVAAYLIDAIGIGTEAFPSKYRTTDVMNLIRCIHREESFDGFPILADAVQDAGGEEDVSTLLAHWRNPDALHSLASWIFRAVGIK